MGEGDLNISYNCRWIKRTLKNRKELEVIYLVFVFHLMDEKSGF